MTFRCRQRSHRTQRGAGPFGIPAPSYPRNHGERRDACKPFRPHFCFCERILRARAPLRARGSDDLRVGSAAQVHVEGFTCALRGQRACSGVRVRAAHHAWHRCAQNAVHLAHNRPFSTPFTEVVCTLGTTPPQTATSPPPNGGNDVIRDPTRRRHADSQLLMLQNPHHWPRDRQRFGRFNLIGKIQPDQKGLNPPDRV